MCVCVYGLVLTGTPREARSRGFRLIIAAMFYVVAKHRNILGTFKLDMDLQDEHFEYMYEAGREACVVRQEFFKGNKPSPYQIAIEFEAPALADQFRKETKVSYFYEFSGEWVELGNKKSKTKAKKSNWVKNASNALANPGLKRGTEFKDKWRPVAYQMLVGDYAKTVEALVLGIYTPGQVAHQRAKSVLAKRIRPVEGACDLCAQVMFDDDGKCTHVLCSSQEMKLVKETARNGSRTPNVVNILTAFSEDIAEVSFDIDDDQPAEEARERAAPKRRLQERQDAKKASKKPKLTTTVKKTTARGTRKGPVGDNLQLF